MESQFNLYQLILASGVAYGLLLSVLLFQKGAVQKPLQFLAFTLLAFTLLNWRIFLVSTDWSERYPFLALISFLPTLAIMPSLFFYVKELAGHKYKPAQLAWHYLPFGIHFLYQFIRFAPAEWREKVVHGTLASAVSWVITLTLLAQIVFYSRIIFLIIAQYEQELKQNFSDLAKLSLNWIKRLLVFMLSVFACWFVLMLVSQFYGKRIIDFQWLFVLLSAFIYWVGTEGLSKGVFYQVLSLQIKPKSEPINPNDYKKAEELIDIINSKQLFRHNQLSMAELAEEVGWSAREVSYLINQVLGKNFYQLMNELRLEAFLMMAKDNSKQHFSLLGLALEAGFNSKSVFNDFFKKQMKMSPKQYLEINKNKS